MDYFQGILFSTLVEVSELAVLLNSFIVFNEDYRFFIQAFHFITSHYEMSVTLLQQHI